MIQFIKAVKKTGEQKAVARNSDLFEIKAMGTGFITDRTSMKAAGEAAVKAWESAYERITSNRYDMVILDELTYVFKYDLVPRDTIIEALINKPKDLHIVVTGRDAPQELIEIADMVTEMHETKHHLHQGLKSQRGIEF
jgi:cob(I)alamin adenosyltransferase